MTTHLSSRSLRFSAFQLFSLILVLFASISLLAQSGTTFWVSTTGNDSNPGTFALPWKTIQHAATTVTAGATVNVMGGVYNEWVSFPNSGTAVAPITFQSYPVVNGTTVQPAVIDGTGLVTASGTKGLITISGARSYITVNGFELRNVVSASKISCGVYITGSGTGVQILNNLVHNVSATCGLFAYGTSQTPITQLVISGNEFYNLKTGSSESMTMNGNVTHFQITNNIVHDNNNIGIDIIGYERTGPAGYDEASYGVVSGNTVYNISGIANSGESEEYDADGLYCDGCAYTTFENNVIFQVDYGIETTSENTRCLITGTEWPGQDFVGTPATGTYPCYGRYATVRNNLFYYENAAGNSIGGYALAKAKGGGGNGGGSSFHDVFVNNTLFDNGTQPGNATVGTPSGDFETQYQLGTQQADYFENNVIYESASSPYSVSPNMWINSYVPSTQVYPPGLTYTGAPATLNWNLYGSDAGYVEGTSILWADVSSFTSFSDYQTTTGEDANSINADPLFVNFGDTPPNVYTNTDSPVVGAGSTSLSCSVGWCDPNGSSPSSIYGVTDFLGNPRMNGSAIDIGAFQNTGNGLSNSMTVNLTSGASTLQYGQSTTLTVTVTALPGVGGAPSGTVSIYNGQTLLETATLLPTGANSTAASMPLSASQLPAGDDTLTAVYSGNSIAPCCNPSNPPGGPQTPVPWYPSATSQGITIDKTLVSNTVTFTTPAPSTAEYGSSFTVAASGLGTGAITYTSDGVACTNSGATYTMISGTGTCTVTATQAADNNYDSASASEYVTAEAANATVTVTLTSGNNPSNYGDTLQFSAALNSDTGAVKGRRTTKRPKDLNGSVAWTWTDLNNNVYPLSACNGTVSGNPTQTVTCTTSALSGGTDTVTATYTASDSNHNSGVSGSVSQTVNQATNAVTFTTPAPSSAEYGSSFTVAASGLGTGAITYTSDGVVCTNSGATYTMIQGSGTCTVTASQAADNNYAAASNSASVTAEPAVGSVSVTLTSGSNPSIYGGSVTFTATVTSDTGAVKGRRTTKRPRDLNGSVSWSGNTGCSASSVSGNPPQTATCTTSILGGGTDTVTATYTANDSNHTTGSGSINQSVNPVSQTITVSTSAPSTAIDNSSFTIVASASSGLPVSFASSGSCTNSGGTYTITAGSRAGSICYETVSQAGNNNYTAANAVTEDTTVAGQTTPTVSFTGPSPSKAVYGTTFQVTASSVNDTSVPVITTSTGTACQIAGSTTNGTTVTATIQMLTGNESCKLAANWAVNTVFKADSKSLTVTAEKVTPTVSFTGAPATANNGGTFTVTAASNSSATPSITSASPAVCSIGSFGGNGPGSYQATVTMLKATGTCKLKAVWPINADYTNASAVQSTTAE